MTEAGAQSQSGNVLGSALSQVRVSTVRETLSRKTGQKRWIKKDQWSFFLKARNSIFNQIRRSAQFKDVDWTYPDIAADIDKEFIRRSKAQAKQVPKRGEMPMWAIEGNWMEMYPEVLEWLRKEYIRNRSKQKQPGAAVVVQSSNNEQPEELVDNNLLVEGAERNNWDDVMGIQRG